MAIIILDNLSNIIFNDPNHPSGSLVFVGDNANSDLISLTFESYGGVTFTGLADYSLPSSYFQTTGSIFIAGSHFANATYVYDQAGGHFRSAVTTDISGVAKITGKFSVPGDGMLVVSGSIPDFQTDANWPSFGGLSLSGSSDVSTSFYYYYANGSLSWTGRAAEIDGFIFNTVSGLILGGDATQPVVGYNYEPEGSICAIGSALANVLDHYTIILPWKIRESVTASVELDWAVGERPAAFYRVQGKCKPAHCPPIDPLGCTPDSNFTYIVNIYAHNLAEVCQKLRDRNMIFPIASIQQFSTPANISDYTSTTNTSCNQLTDVTPPLTFIPCQDLLVDYSATSNFGFGMVAIPFILGYNGGGSLGLSGGLCLQSFNEYDTSGVLGLSGTADCNQHDYEYQAVGSFTTSNEVHEARSLWYYSPSGGIFAGAYAPITFAYWVWEPSGGVGLSNKTELEVYANPIEMTGGFTTGNSTAFGPADFLPFIVDASGNLFYTGQSVEAMGQYLVNAAGGFGVSGEIRWESSAITVEFSGGPLFTGLSALILENGGGGMMSFDGCCDVVVNPAYVTYGTIGWKGEADITSSDKQASGFVGFGGSAIVASSTYGTKTFNVAASVFVANEVVSFAYQPAALLLPAFSTVSTKCCPLNLPIRLRVSHDLGTANYFSRFLQRNVLTINTPIDIYYKSNEVAWYNTLHFQGWSPDFPTIEQWILTFGFQCNNSDSSQTLGNLGSYWTFTFMANLRSVNNVNITQRITRLVCGFDSNSVCLSNKPLYFAFDFDTQAVITTPGTIQTLAYVDDIGLFKSPAFIADPTITFKISELAVDIPQAVIDIGPSVSSAIQVGVGDAVPYPPPVS